MDSPPPVISAERLAPTHGSGPPAARAVAEGPARVPVHVPVHVPVLGAEVSAAVPDGARRAVDLTVGYGGHAEALLRHHPQLELLALDADPQAVAASQKRLAPFGSERVHVQQSRFSEAGALVLEEEQDFILADLGVSSPQLDAPERGFSWREAGPLDMRMDPSQTLTAAELVHNASEAELRQILFRFGEEPHARRIARAIVQARGIDPIRDTVALAERIERCIPGGRYGSGAQRNSRKRPGRRYRHAATLSFQALRIAVNDEIAQLEHLLERATNWLAPGGRLAILTFHSLEDRLVKHHFRRWSQDCLCPPQAPQCLCGGQRALGKPWGRALTPSPEEIAANPRARSARLRVFTRALF